MDTLKDIEALVLANLKKTFSPSIYDLWFSSLKLVSLDGMTAVFSIESNFKQELISKRHAGSLQTALREAVGFDAEIVVESRESKEGFHPTEIKEKAEEPKKNKSPLPDDPEPPKIDTERAIEGPSIVNEYTFENFIEGESNKFALAACRAVALYSSNPDESEMDVSTYNPLFIYGGTGLGKTHLMEAIGHYVMNKSPETSVCYITSETFLNEYINAIAAGTMAAFRDRYRKVDVLLLDDVQFIVGKKQFQEEFFNTFNFLLLYNKQVVMTSDVAPKNLQGLEERLISRFQQGMVVEIESPSYETRLAILKSKAHTLKRVVPNEVLTYIAENIKSHVRALEGALQRVEMFIVANPEIPMNIDVARGMLRDYIEEEEQIKELEIADIMQTVASYFGVTVAGLKSSERTQTLVTPRQMAMYLCRKLTPKSTPNIAEAFEKKHSTILHGATTIQTRLETEEELRKQAREIVIQLGRKPEDLLSD